MDPLRSELLLLLDGGRAHVRVLDAVTGFAPEHRGLRLPGCAHSPWELLEHLRIAQQDILDYCLGSRYRERPFPDGYWPRHPTPPNRRAWARSVAAFRADLGRLRAVVRDRTIDVLTPLPRCGVSWLHELCIVANHNSYHAGQLVQLRKSLHQQRP